MPEPKLTSLVANSRNRAESFGLEDHFSLNDLIVVLESCQYRCMACHKHYSECMLSVDHVVPLSLGGVNTKDNIQILCKRCNSAKHIKTIDYRISFVPSGLPVVRPDYSPTSRKRLSSACEAVPIMVRLPPELHQWVKAQAERELRSLNAQIIILLQRAKETDFAHGD